MIQKIFITALLILSAITNIYADKRITVKLDNDQHRQETVELAYCNIFLDMENDDDDDIKVNIQLENLQENKEILLFMNSYDEKVLKKMRPTPIIYDKYFGGTKGMRVIESCNGLDKDYQISPSNKEKILTLSGIDKNIMCRIPLYIAGYKKKKGLLCRKQQLELLEKTILELEIEIELKPDSLYQQLSNECNKILEEFENTLFCTNKKHKPSIFKQKDDFQEKINTCISKITEEIEANNWYSSDKKYKLYDELREKLKNLDLSSKEGDCGKHKASNGHKCKFCNMTLQQIYHKLDDFYQKIYSSNDRKATKEEVINDVKSLYNCSMRRKDWNISEYKSKIIDRYNRINKF